MPEDRREYQSKTALALEMLERAQARGHLEAQWVAGDSAFGMSPTFRDGLAAAGMRYVPDVRPDMTVWPLEPAWTGLPYQGNGRPRKPRLRGGQRQTMQERAAAIPADGWREITVAEGSQGPRIYRFSAQRVRPTSRRNPGDVHWSGLVANGVSGNLGDGEVHLGQALAFFGYHGLTISIAVRFSIIVDSPGIVGFFVEFSYYLEQVSLRKLRRLHSLPSFPMRAEFDSHQCVYIVGNVGERQLR